MPFLAALGMVSCDGREWPGGRALSGIDFWLRQSNYNPVEEPSWNSAASMATSALQNGGSWLSPLGLGAPAAAPPRATSQVFFPS